MEVCGCVSEPESGSVDPPSFHEIKMWEGLV